MSGVLLSVRVTAPLSHLPSLAAYALASLQLAGDERDDSPYAHGEVAGPVARRIAEVADRNFLVAGLIARDHGLHDHVAVRPDELAATSSVEAALARFVERLPQRGPVRPELALAALAFAEAPGLGAHLWAMVIGALSGVTITDDEVPSRRTASATAAASRAGVDVWRTRSRQQPVAAGRGAVVVVIGTLRSSTTPAPRRPTAPG